MKPSYLIIVRRDRLDVIERIRRSVAGVPVFVDRRHADRRATPTPGESAPRPPPAREGFTERRQADRRRAPPSTWETKGFILVLDPAAGDREARG